MACQEILWKSYRHSNKVHNLWPHIEGGNITNCFSIRSFYGGSKVFVRSLWKIDYFSSLWKNFKLLKMHCIFQTIKHIQNLEGKILRIKVCLILQKIWYLFTTTISSFLLVTSARVCWRIHQLTVTSEWCVVILFHSEGMLLNPWLEGRTLCSFAGCDVSLAIMDSNLYVKNHASHCF